MTNNRIVLQEQIDIFFNKCEQEKNNQYVLNKKVYYIYIYILPCINCNQYKI